MFIWAILKLVLPASKAMAGKFWGLRGFVDLSQIGRFGTDLPFEKLWYGHSDLSHSGRFGTGMRQKNWYFL